MDTGKAHEKAEDGENKNKTKESSPLVGVPLSDVYTPKVEKRDVWEKRHAELTMRHDRKRRVKGSGAFLARISSDADDKKKVRGVYADSGLQQLKRRSTEQNHSAKVKAYLVSNVELDPNLLFNLTK